MLVSSGDVVERYQALSQRKQLNSLAASQMKNGTLPIVIPVYKEREMYSTH